MKSKGNEKPGNEQQQARSAAGEQGSAALLINVSQDSAGEMPAPRFFTVTREQVVREALEGVARNRARVIPGALVAVVMILASMIPIFVLRFFLNRPPRRVSTIHNA